MPPLPKLWQPLCPHCGEEATPRLALGDEEGPRQTGGLIACDACGSPLDLDHLDTWRRLDLEAVPAGPSRAFSPRPGSGHPP